MITPYDFLKLLIPFLCIVLLICVIKLIKPAKDGADKTTAAVTTEESTEAPTESETETSAPAAVYKTTDVLNVRPEPSTDSGRIGQLEAGTQVEYVRAHDDKWAVIMYDGKEAYVASQYLTSE